MAGLEDVQPHEITFKERLADCEVSTIYQVEVRGQTCVMKVHHGRENCEDADHRPDYHSLEAAAYRRLKERGVCDRGIVPQFYGTMDNFDPKPCHPYLKRFKHDDNPPSAIFMEYIPNLEMLYLDNYTPQRLDGFVHGLREIHKALVRHRDPKPRNMLISNKGDRLERLVWLDFDRADTYQTITERERKQLDTEERRVVSFKTLLEEDIANGGELSRAGILYW
ncbi:hypothetical protein FQN54_001330 [Arachnomyces sp. PD_36]|nr:hypothetical protein FQN54_001330 [Arachnomyces sp. PD_36]